jgi:abequosyltransferase
MTENKTVSFHKNELLSICIPTYNHAEPLQKCLTAMIPQAKKLGIPIYISDNASTDNTVEIIEFYQKIYPLLYYRVNAQNLGVDKNMVLAVQMAQTKYVWAIGARRIIKSGMLQRIYNILENEKPDLIVLNDPNPIFISPKTGFYYSEKEVFRELNRNLTGLGFQVMPLQAWKTEYISKYDGTEWTVLGVALEYLASIQNVKAYFIAEPSLDSSGDSHWHPRAFEIWAKWKKTIKMLPNNYDADKEYVVPKGLNLFFVKPNFDLINMRQKGIYTHQVYMEISGDIKKYCSISPGIAYVISKTPIKTINAYNKFIHTATVLASKTIRVFIRPKTRFNVQKNIVKKIDYQ